MTQYLSNFTQKFQPVDTLIDPVSKFRVSQPQNLTDTDFEYGLQESKWETLERVNNIPTFFSRYGDPSLDIAQINAIQGSDRITVVTNTAHNLIVGSPIIVSGLSSNSAEGAYVVVRVISATSFEYAARRTQSFPGLTNGANFSIKLDESTISAGKLYQGTQYKLDNLDTIQTDGADPSQLTVKTNTPHGFTVGTKFILSNTVGGKTFKFDGSLVQPQSVVETTVQTNLPARVDNTKLYESFYATNYDWRGRFGVFVTADDINIRENTITAPNHGFVTGDVVVYIAPRTDKGGIGVVDYSIGGLSNYTPYWVIRIDANKFALSASEVTWLIGTTSSYVGLSHPGNTDFAPHHFAKGYRITASSTTEQTLAFANRDIENGFECVLISTGTGLVGVDRSTDNFNTTSWRKYFYQNTTVNTGTGYNTIEFNFARLNITTDIIDFPSLSLSALDFKTGDEVRFYQGGSLPAGITNGSIYYVRVLSDTTLQLYTTRANAISGGATNLVNFTSQGTGTHKLEKTRRFMRFATNQELTAFAPTNTTAPNGTTVVVPIIDLTSTARDSIYIQNHGLSTSDVVLADSELMTTGISRERLTNTAAINDTGKLAFEAQQLNVAQSRFTPFGGITLSKFQTGTRVRYDFKPDFAYFLCSNVNTTTDVITTEGDTTYSSLRSFYTGEAVTLDVFPEPISFPLTGIQNPNADTTLFATTNTKLYENAPVASNPVRVVYRADTNAAYAAPDNTLAGRELIDGNIYWFRVNAANSTFILFNSQAGAINQTVANRVRPVSTGNGVGSIIATDPLPQGLSTGTTYYIRVLSTTTFSLHTTSQGAIDNTNRVDIINAGPGVRARVRQLNPSKLPGGIVAGSDYYIRNISNTNIELYNTRANAMNTGSTTGLVTYTSPTFNSGNGLHQFDAIEHVQLTSGRSGTTGSLLTVPDSSIYVAGQEILYINNPQGSGTATPGMNFGSRYFVRPVSGTTISIHRTATGAITNTNFITLSGAAGSGNNGMLVSSSGIPTVGEGFNYIVDVLSSNRIRLRESQSSLTFQNLNPSPYLSARLSLTKRTPAENSETIFINQHGLSQGTELIYNSASFDPIPVFSEFNEGYTETTLTNNAEYYVVTPSQNRFRLARTADSIPYTFTADAGTVDTTAFTLTIPNHAIRTGDRVVYESVNPITGLNSGSVYYALRMNDSVITFANNTAWDATNDLLNVTHGYGANGTILPVIYRTAPNQGGASTGTAAGGLVLERLYYVRVTSASTLDFYNTLANANAQVNKVNITGQGTGTGYLERSNRIALFYSIRDLYDNQTATLTIDPLTGAGQTPGDKRVAILSFTATTTQRITKYDIIDFSQAGEPGEQELGNVLPNAVDGIYEIESIIGNSSSTQFVLSPTNAILSPRTLTFDPREAAQLQYSMLRFDSHALYDRAPVVYNPDRIVNVGQVFWISPDPNPAVDTNIGAFINISHGITTPVRARYESTTPVYPLSNNTSYFLRALNATSFAVYNTLADATNDTNRILLSDNFGANPIEGTGKFFVESQVTPLGGLENNTTYYVIRRSANFISLATTIQNANTDTAITITDNGVAGELHTIQTFNVAAEVEGLGTLNTTSGSNIITGTGTSFFNLFKIGDILKISVPRTNIVRNITQNGTTMAPGGTITINGHGFLTGEAVRYTSGTPAGGLTNNFTYYTRLLSVNTFTLHRTRNDAVNNANIITITGTPSGTGDFTTIYPGTVFEAKINGIKTDTSLIIDRPIPATDSDIAATPIGTQTGLKYLIGSTLYVKGDGFALHRPFDGGVELTPSLNPDSQITRQTRKYFRYQSGKGLQVSFGINFNAPVQIDSMAVDSAGVATIKTRYPNRITEGLEIDIVKAEDNLAQPERNITAANTSIDTDNNTMVFTTPHFYNNGLGVKYEGSGAIGELIPGTTYYVRIPTTAPSTSIEFYTTLSGALLGTQAARVELDADAINGKLIPENPWNGRYEVTQVIDERTFRVQLSSQPPSPFAQGFSQYTPVAWSNSYLRAGMFDDQNGMYFEYDGQDLYVCRRSSTNQLSGTVAATFNSGEIIGTGTIFLSQLDRGNKIVIRGQTYKVVNISSNNVLHIQPPYSGESKSNIIVSKVEEIRVPQSEWNLDKADGNGPSGFTLDLTKMQMAYMDYSWYGAGKVRFGFKGLTGDVVYFHEMVHNNRETEAYLRSGNLPTRYEVENIGTPTYSPTIAHWGTSVIMDGGFDDDKAYQFNAASRTLSWTNNAEQQVFSGTIPASGGSPPQNFATVPVFITDPDTGRTTQAWRILAATFTSVASIRNNTAISGTNIQAGTLTIGQPVASGGSTGIVYIDKQPTGNVATATNFNVGPASDLLPLTIPLVSVRLGPAVDNGFVGRIGVRDIINRMQLALAQVGIITTHDVNVKLLLNPNLDNISYTGVEKPSLSQLIRHEKGDVVNQGIEIFNFRVNGNSSAVASIANTVTQELSDVFELGNSILGGDGTFPDGPDVITVAVEPIDTSLITQTTPFRVSASITWTESQA